jgi:hypothetical protein
MVRPSLYLSLSLSVSLRMSDLCLLISLFLPPSLSLTVRTREVGIKQIHQKINPNQVELIRRDYTGNGGWETFLAYEDPVADILVGLLRLRQCSSATFRPEMKDLRCSIVRELHVYGSAVPVQARDPTKFQHQVRFSFSHSLFTVCTHCG